MRRVVIVISLRLLPIVTTAFNVNNVIPEAIAISGLLMNMNNILSPHERRNYEWAVDRPRRFKNAVSSNDYNILAAPSPSHVDGDSFCLYMLGNNEGGAINDKFDDAAQGRNSNRPTPPSRNEENPFRKNGRIGNNDNDDQSIPYIAIAAVLVTAVLASTVFLERFDMNNPTVTFDVDMFMALKSTLDSGIGGIQNNGGDLMMDNDVVMMKEVPSLLPGNQIVGAMFGSP